MYFARIIKQPKKEIMQLRKFELKNIKNIESFEHEFNGNVYFFKGDNEQGKTTLMNAIFSLLTGKVGPNALKKGEKSGIIKGEFEGENGKYEVEIKLSEKNPNGTISITKNGLKTTKKSFLQEAFNYKDFDASDFIQLSNTAEGRRKQVDVVKSLLPEAAKARIDEIDTSVAQAKETRKEHGINEKRIKALISSSPEFTEEELEKYAAEMSVEEIIKKQSEIAVNNEKLKNFNERLIQAKANLEGFDAQKKNEIKASSTVDSWETKIADLEKQAEVIQTQIKLAKESHKKAISEDEKKLADAVAEKELLAEKVKAGEAYAKKHKITSTDDLDKEINEAKEHNAKHAEVLAYKSNKEDLLQVSTSVDKCNTKIEVLQLEKAKLIKSSNLPIDGLEIDEDGLKLNGVPFVKDAVSTSQEMEVAFAIITAMNKDTKMFRISRAESLGGKKMKAIIDFAKKNNLQGFMEIVVPNETSLIVDEYKEV